MINIFCPSRYKINRKLIKKEVNVFFQEKNIPFQSILNIIFIGKNKMKKLASSYKNEDIALPVLSFPYNPKKDGTMGEIFICYPQTILLAAERNKKVDEIILQLIKHGIENLLKSI